MRVNKWTLGLAAAGLVSLPAVMQAEENMNQVWTALSSTTISGFVDTSMHWDLGTGNANTPVYGFSSGKQDGFNLNVVQLSLERPLDESQWAAGYKVDLLFGPDANLLATQSINTTGGATASDFGIRQAYVALRAPVGNGLDFKVGVFDTIIGYEVINSSGNPNYTRSYGWSIEPTTHTGVLMSYQFNDMLSASAGIANTHGPAINAKAPPAQAESYKTYMGSVAFTAPDDWGALAGSALYAGVMNGFSSGAGADQANWYVGATMATPIEGFRVGASYDYRGISKQTRGGVSITSSYANATALYASFQATEKMTFHTRAEYFSQSKGAVGLPSKVFALTGTAQYDLWKNVISRLELRWDHQADGTSHAYGNSKGSVAGGDLRGTKRNAYLIAANLIYQF